MRAKILASLVLVTGLLVLPGASAAQPEDSGYTFALSLVLGGTSDAEPDPGFDNLGFQAMFALERSPHVFFSARAGILPMDTDEGGGLFDADLSYITVGGEYHFPEGFYESGLIIGIGFYDLSGDTFVPDESSFGFNLGVNGDFRINDRFSIIGELSGHIVDMDYTNFFITANAGVAYHF